MSRCKQFLSRSIPPSAEFTTKFRAISLPTYTPFALLFWAVQLLSRVIFGTHVSFADFLLPMLLFLPWTLRSRWQRIVVSVATYFVVYYVAFLPLLDSISARANWHHIPEFESQLLLGWNPIISIQRYRNTILDAVFCIGYSIHIFNIIVPLFYLLFRNKHSDADGYVSAFLACGYLGFTIYLLYPVAPPRLAMPGVESVAPPWASGTWEVAGEWFRANPYAAMPSLHCAFPFLSYLYLRHKGYALKWLFAVTSVWLFVGTIYLGEHYLSDVVGAIIVAYLAFFTTARIEKVRHEAI